jgi:hypothetical protein
MSISRPSCQAPSRSGRRVAGALAAVVAALGAGLLTVGMAGAAPADDRGSFPGCPELRESVRSTECVQTLQMHLNTARVAYALAEDGWFGVATGAAVRDFQHRHDLPVDGVVGRATADRLLAEVGDVHGRGEPEPRRPGPDEEDAGPDDRAVLHCVLHRLAELLPEGMPSTLRTDGMSSAELRTRLAVVLPPDDVARVLSCFD